MIKPNTICFLRGFERNSPHYIHEGKIVTVLGQDMEYTLDAGEPVYRFNPEVTTNGFLYRRSRQRYLHPLQDFDTQDLQVTELETQ